MNLKLFRHWQKDAYYKWLNEERDGLASALVSLSEDVKEKTLISGWARDTRIPQILLEIKEIDDEINLLEAKEEEVEG